MFIYLYQCIRGSVLDCNDSPVEVKEEKERMGAAES